MIEGTDPDPDGAGLQFAVVRCADCDTCYTCPRPDPSTIGQFYTAAYGPHRQRKPEKPRTARRSPFARLLGRPCMERRALPWRGQGRLLDFGCGAGSYLERMRAQGWKVTGLDVSEQSVERVRTELQVPALVGTLPHPELAPESFDVITMWHSLEHVHDPLEVLRAARDLLAPGGQLFVAVPNIDSAPFRWFGPAWFGLDLPRHLTHFSPRTLRAMIQRAGFRVARQRQIRHSDWLKLSARRAVEMGVCTTWQRMLLHKPAARSVAWAAYATGQADCIFAVGEKD